METSDFQKAKSGRIFENNYVSLEFSHFLYAVEDDNALCWLL